MAKVNIEFRYKGEKGSIILGTDPEDFTYGEYLDFLKCAERYAAILEKDDPDAFEPELLYEAVSYLIPGDIGMLPLYLPDDKKGEALPPLTKGLSVFRLYYFLQAVMARHIPSFDLSGDDYSCEYKGEKFFLKQRRAVNMISDAAVATVEVVETNILYKILKDAVVRNSGDPFGQLEFEADTKMMAILLRREGEELPVNKIKRDAFIRERAEYFKDLPMTVVLDVTFFLTRISRVLKKSLYIQRSLKERPLSALSKVRMKRSKKHARRSFKKLFPRT